MFSFWFSLLFLQTNHRKRIDNLCVYLYDLQTLYQEFINAVLLLIFVDDNTLYHTVYIVPVGDGVSGLFSTLSEVNKKSYINDVREDTVNIIQDTAANWALLLTFQDQLAWSLKSTTRRAIRSLATSRTGPSRTYECNLSLYQRPNNCIRWSVIDRDGSLLDFHIHGRHLGQRHPKSWAEPRVSPKNGPAPR